MDAARRKYIEVNNLEIISNGGKLLMHASIIRIKLTIYIQNRNSVYQTPVYALLGRKNNCYISALSLIFAAHDLFRRFSSPAPRIAIFRILIIHRR